MYIYTDGIITTDKNSAPLSPIVSKASTGCLEKARIYTTKNLASLIRDSKELDGRPLALI